jgi:predicted TIM-barrel fold metal-dependent hydrolase
VSIVTPSAGGTPAVRNEVAAVDCDAHTFPFAPDLEPYLATRWQTYLNDIGLRTPTEFGLVRARAMAAKTDAWSPEGRPPGNDPGFFVEDLLDRWSIDIAVLNPSTMFHQGFVGGNQPAEFTAALMSAANAWTNEKWLDLDPRMFASVCTPFEEPDLAAAEIDRWASHPRFVQILLPFRTQRPIGNRKYWPLIEAVVSHDVPIALHPGSIGNHQVTASGWPSFYYEDHVGLPQALAAQIASLVCEGTFERWPTLKIVIQEGGWSWVAPFCWRLDRAWEQLRSEVPHLKRKPSEYVQDHFWFTSQPIEEPEQPRHLLDAWEMFNAPDRLMFSSDYPHWDFDAPDRAIPASLGEDVRRSIMAGNALKLYASKMGPRDG